jgi:hypothetical protein
MSDVMLIEEFLYYNTSTQGYTQPQKVTLDRFCNGVTVINAGTSNVVFDDEILVPGESKAISGNRKEIFIGRKDLSFSGAGTNLCYVTQKYYVKLDPTNPHNLDTKSL